MGGWAGSIMCSTDSGATYSACGCPTCGSGKGSQQFAVDGDASMGGSDSGAATCLGGSRCQVQAGMFVVSSSLTFAGLTEPDARSFESDLAKGVADAIVGVSAADVTIT